VWAAAVRHRSLVRRPMPLLRRPRPNHSRQTLGLTAAAILAAPLLAPAQGTQTGGRESVEIEPYTGAPIYLPEGEAPPPPKEVEARVVTENFPETDVLRFERRVVRYSDDSVVSDGPHKEFYSNGQLYVDGEFDRGVATGTWTYHHPNGQVAKTVEFVDGKPNGEVKVYNEEGVLIAERRYANGKRDGEWAIYSEDGETRLREDHYDNGTADGVFRVWHPNGQLQREVPFVDGKQNGVATEWTRTGEKRAEVTFKDGVKDGPATLWQSDGKVVEQQYEDGRLVIDQ